MSKICGLGIHLQKRIIAEMDSPDFLVSSHVYVVGGCRWKYARILGGQLFRRHCANLLYSSSTTMLCSIVAECRCSAQADVTLTEDHFRRTAIGLGSGQFWSQCPFCCGKQPIPCLSSSGTPQLTLTYRLACPYILLITPVIARNTGVSSDRANNDNAEGLANHVYMMEGMITRNLWTVQGPTPTIAVPAYIVPSAWRSDDGRRWSRSTR